MRTRSGTSGGASPQKRRRTRSTNAGDEDSAAKRRDFGLRSDEVEPEAIDDRDEGEAAAINGENDSSKARNENQRRAAQPADPPVTSQPSSESTAIDTGAIAPTVDISEMHDLAAATSLLGHSYEYQTAPEQPMDPMSQDLSNAGQVSSNVQYQDNAFLQNGQVGTRDPFTNGDDQGASGQSQSYGPYTTDHWPDPNLHLRIHSLPILENLSVQILGTLAKTSHQEALNTVAEPESATGQAYATLKSLFDQTKKIYADHEPFLSADQLNLRDPEHRNIARKANLATFVSSIFGSQDVGFYHLNEFFLETFVPDGGRLLKSQGGLYLDLKTQAYLSAMLNGERSRTEILQDLFPDDLELILLSRRLGAKQLSPSEIDFVKRARSRRDHLLSEPDDEESFAALPDKYVWEDFLRDVSAYVGRHFEDLVNAPVSHSLDGSSGETALTAEQASRFMSSRRVEMDNNPQTYDSRQPNIEEQMDDSDVVGLREALQAHIRDEDPQESNHSIVERAARAAQFALQNDDDQRMSHEGGQDHSIQPDLDQVQEAANWPSYGHISGIPYHTQSAPTQVLYERARLAASSKASPNNRRAGVPSQRRPWTTEEENSLMAGLDRVKGPHWSQILAMFGAGGSINESLKDRNQVQLKDKARNLKLFFLKSGIEVPYYLQFVTGELKTRAPSQAAKNEARERERLRGEEDRAHVEGVLALANTANQPGGEGYPSTESMEQTTPGTQPAPTLSVEQRLAEQLGGVQNGHSESASATDPDRDSRGMLKHEVAA